MKRFSICIPTYEMTGYGHVVVNELMHELKMQSFQDFDIVISDQSNDSKILDVVHEHSKDLDIKFMTDLANRGKATANINKAMRYAEGEIIKIMFQDDFFVNFDALKIISAEFDKGAKWTTNAFTHTVDKKQFFNTKPSYYQDSVITGRNSIGNPSNIAVHRDCRVYTDTNLIHLFDCEYYWQLKHKNGMPNIINEVLVCSRLHPASVSMTDNMPALIAEEAEYCCKKYNIKKEDYNYDIYD
jgi:hypothetical protein